jgi:hypothetical protein
MQTGEPAAGCGRPQHAGGSRPPYVTRRRRAAGGSLPPAPPPLRRRRHRRQGRRLRRSQPRPGPSAPAWYPAAATAAVRTIQTPFTQALEAETGVAGAGAEMKTEAAHALHLRPPLPSAPHTLRQQTSASAEVAQYSCQDQLGHSRVLLASLCCTTWEDTPRPLCGEW